MKLRIALLPLLGVPLILGAAALAPSIKGACTPQVLPPSSPQSLPANVGSPGITVSFYTKHNGNSGTMESFVPTGAVTGAATYSQVSGGESIMQPGEFIDGEVWVITPSSGSGYVRFTANTTCGTATDSVAYVIVP